MAISNAHFGFSVPQGIDIAVWDRLVTKAHLMCVNASHPAVEWLLAMLCVLRRYLRSLQADPRNLKKLFTVVLYRKLWLSAREARTSGAWTR